MKATKSIILNKIEEEYGSATKYAIRAGYANAAKFKEMLSKKGSEIRYFEGFVKVVIELCPDNYLEMMSNLVDEVNPSGKRTAINLLEFLSTNRQSEAMKNLIDKMIDTKNEDWAKAYSIQYENQFAHPKVNHEILLQKIKSIKSSDSELQIFLNILKTYCYHQKGKFNMVSVIAEELEFDFKNVNDSYLVSMYKCRFSETMSYIHLRILNDEEKCREYADHVLASNIGKSFKAYAYFVKGYSYLFTSYDNALINLKKSIEMYDMLGGKPIVKDLEEKVEMLQVYWDKKKDECEYNKNKAFHMLKENRDITDLLDKFGDEIDRPFYLYLKGANEKNNDLLLESAIEYMHLGDSFLANFPKIEAIKNGFSEKVINNLLSIRVS